MKNKVIFFGDSIIRYKYKKEIFDWTLNFKKLLKFSQKKNNHFKTYSYIGLNSNQAVKLLPNILKKNKKIETLVIQIGINDSWHFKSLKGKANVNSLKFKKQMQDKSASNNSDNSKKSSKSAGGGQTPSYRIIEIRSLRKRVSVLEDAVLQKERQINH